MVAMPPTVRAMLFNTKAFTRLSEAHPQKTRPIVLVTPIIDKMKAHLSGVQPVGREDWVRGTKRTSIGKETYPTAWHDH